MGGKKERCNFILFCVTGTQSAWGRARCQGGLGTRFDGFGVPAGCLKWEGERRQWTGKYQGNLYERTLKKKKN